MTLYRILERIKQTLVPKGDVEERAVKSGIWRISINIFDRGLQLVKLIIIARLLSPAAIGLIGIALLTLTVLEQLSRFGIDEAIIQREEENVNRYLNTAWVLQVARGTLVAAVAFVVAPYAATFFNEPSSTALIRILALSSLLTGLRNPGLVYFRKRLEFHKAFVYTLTGSLVNTIVTIGMAFALRSVWAFVFGRIAGNLTMLVLSYVIHHYRPRLEFDRAQARELIGYGKWIMGSGVLLFLINQGDDAFVGWFLTASALGFYQFAFRMSNAPATEITNVVTSVAFPAYSQVQSDVKKLRSGFLRTVQLTMLVSFPMAVGIAVTAPTFVRGFLGPEWSPMVMPMQILAVGGAIRSLGSSSGPLFKAIGRPDYGTKLHVLRLAIVAILIYPATSRWGISGTALVVVFGAVPINGISCYLAVRQIESGLLDVGRLVSYPATASLVMALCIEFVRQNLRLGLPILEFAILIVVGILTYSIVIVGFERQFDIGIGEITHRLINVIR